MIPYVDFTREYPTGTGLFYWFLSFFLADAHRSTFIVTNLVVFSLIETANSIIFYKILVAVKGKRPFFFTLVYLLLPTGLLLGPFQCEPLVNFFFFLGILTYYRNKEIFSSITLGIGTAIKWYPVVWFINSQSKAFAAQKNYRNLLMQIAIFVLTLSIFNLPFIFYSYYQNHSISNWFSTYAFHLKRDLMNDTPFGVMRLWGLGLNSYSYLSYLNLLLVIYIFCIKRSLDPLLKTICIIAGALICNQVYSTQFHLWFIPLILIYISRESPRLYLMLLLFLIEICNVTSYPFAFGYTILEIGLFQPNAAIGAAGIWTWVLGATVMLRSLLLMEFFCILFPIESVRIKLFVRGFQGLCVTFVVCFLIYTAILIHSYQ